LKNGENGDKIARYEFINAPNIHLRNKYDELQNQLQKVGERREKKEGELEALRKRYEKKNQTYEKRLRIKDEELDKLEKSLRKAGEKAQWVKTYFQSKVFGTNNGQSFELYHWGTLLEDLRNKVAHRDRLSPSFDSKETLVEKVLFNWPTLQKMTYDRFCQYMQNGMFSLITNISPILYELEWKSGPYNPDLWKGDL